MATLEKFLKLDSLSHASNPKKSDAVARHCQSRFEKSSTAFLALTGPRPGSFFKKHSDYESTSAIRRRSSK